MHVEMHRSGRRAVTACPSRNLAAESDFLSEGLPDRFSVRNTFIDIVGRPPSLEDFFNEREIHSCPPIWASPLDGVCKPSVLEDFLNGTKEATLEMSDLSRCQSPQPQGFSAWPLDKIDLPSVLEELFSSFEAVPSEMPGEADRWENPPCPAAAQSAQASMAGKCILQLADAIPGKMVASEEFPSIGSVGHHLGNCKPCAFLYTKGCGNGRGCVFCHLCPPDERKRRRVEKKQRRQRGRGVYRN